MNGLWDAIVIGAGPAGMTAAATLSEGGARTLVIDEQPAPGGQIYRAVERNTDSARLSAVLGSDYADGAALTARMRASAAELRFNTSAWRIDADGTVWTKADGKVEQLQAKALVIASGAMERPVPVPGWTLPGVLTVGALQIMLKDAGLRPSGRLVLAGCGPLVYLFAAQCLEAGVSDLVLLDTAKRTNLIPALRHLPKAVCGHGLGYLWKGLGLMAALHRRGVKIYRGVSKLRIEGAERAVAASFRTRTGTIRIDLDLVALHEGVIPSQQIARSIGCAHRWDEEQQCFLPILDPMRETSISGVFIAGDGGGIVGAMASAHTGALCALAILKGLDKISDTELESRKAVAQQALDAHLTIRPFLDRLYRPRNEVLVPADDVVVCRCEAIRAGAIRDIVRRGCLGPNQAKAFLRCGMGPCQGRMCGPTVSAIVAHETGQTPDATGYYRIRPPLKPVSIGELATQYEED
ncbi:MULTISPECIES: NAD(P)/FAD-dependent oxidoreductase [unclassified Mesorhizobium]|uniref:NAD(P)/FAD-dependent oxidoreductase n=1 Tax=unclassified Mesorhizobium TaxID=325217 RepID=UPI001129BB2A|nr:MULTISPECIES: NAD(P)/FAD-dependent oxidoreductase [unclassified Mesorhizobium]TPJ48348.1 FAD-binding protein [Mesorhizobium sp. B2-6-4]TPK49030.1 FAD-binding protein [Mesorhizobium sp. B2-5-2]TPL23623.1 FAD-binding protein [Mesorhizobium sp. B2-4-7]TPL26164.1 FAD-binding protein [Mesorhizobium sp. B2-4-9]TPL32776.1 FAD-binding protein [Mesorhizobium sp. B2-4-5]